MSRWIDLPEEDRRAMIFTLTGIKKIDDTAAEKDWWVTATLFALFHTSVAPYLLFKGGTSLSKAWDIIDRFSEDCDLSLDRSYFLDVKGFNCANAKNNTQLHKLREAGQDFIFGELKSELIEQFRKMDLPVTVLAENEMRDEDGNLIKVAHDKDPSVFYVFYPSLYDTKDKYTQPYVKIEISILSMREPYETRTIKSLIEENFPGEDSDYIIDIRTVSPARTFLEKAFLLCEEYQKSTPRKFRMTRHFYDLDKLSHTRYADIALADDSLYLEIVAHRRKFYHVGYVDYDKELPQNITIVPPEDIREAYEEDYRGLKSSFIYGEAISYDDLIQSLHSIQERLRKIPSAKTR